MKRTVPRICILFLYAAIPGLINAQFNLEVGGRPVQVHSFVQQGFAYSNQNNYLTMQTSHGSGAMTDGGANFRMAVTDRFHVGSQVYFRNIGQLGKWHPELDWAYGDYKFTDWFGVRAGKVKTALGLFNGHPGCGVPLYVGLATAVGVSPGPT